ncbi:MAG: hypothetical protein HC773_05400 [Scytonema sp. CRU_2_7]|nr:hypothetical protein [Scytonema sp. CRU_2_7]
MSHSSQLIETGCHPFRIGRTAATDWLRASGSRISRNANKLEIAANRRLIVASRNRDEINFALYFNTTITA